jgi:hypothetical protein
VTLASTFMEWWIKVRFLVAFKGQELKNWRLIIGNLCAGRYPLLCVWLLTLFGCTLFY